IKNWKAARNNEAAYGNNEDPLELVKQSFNDNVLSLVKAHPETKFYLYYPPYSVLRQQIWYITNPQRYANQLEMKRYIFEQLSAYSNVSIYEFQTDSDITYDLDQYKDLSHHSGAINSLIVDEISKGNHRVTADNLEQNIKLLQRQAENVVVNTAEGTVYSIDVRLNGKEQSFGFLPPATGDIIMAPLKAYAQMLGASFDYNIDNKLITLAKGGITAEITVGSDEAIVDGRTVKLAAAVENKIGVMAAPLESIASLFGGTVTFGEPKDKLLGVDITIGQ
ncbi:copper amine oxidase N-terminal domain-containing protein, partial [Paenibacillus forsythiae]